MAYMLMYIVIRLERFKNKAHNGLRELFSVTWMGRDGWDGSYPLRLLRYRAPAVPKMSFSLLCLHSSLEDLKDTWNCEVGPRWRWSAWCGWPPPPAGGHHLGGEGSGEGWGGGAGGENPQLRLPLGTDHIIIRHTLEDCLQKTLRFANVHCTIISLMVIFYLDLHSVRVVRGFARKQRRHLVRGSSGYLNARESFIKRELFLPAVNV